MKKNKLIILVGPPCSGKSTWSKDYVDKNPKTLRFNRDDLRMMLKGTMNLAGLDESVITRMIQCGIWEGLENSRDIIIDQTNCRLKYIVNFIEDFGDIAEIKIKVFEQPISELKKRNQLRSIETHIPPIPDYVIERMMQSQKALLQMDEFKEFEKNGYLF
jgi:predicted kinase